MKALHRDPDATLCIGRQPAMRKLTPSLGLPWYYGTEVEGQRFTREQTATLMSRGGDPVTATSMIVKRQVDREEVWYSTKELAPHCQMPCPVIGKGADGRIHVIAPNGSVKWIREDGWGKRPRLLPDIYRLKHAMGER